MAYNCVLFALLVFSQVRHVEGQTKYPPQSGGGADGVNGNEFLKGTADTPKLEIRAHCSRSTSTSTAVDMSLYVYQKDTAFKFSNIGPDNDKFVEYTCFLIDAKEYMTNKNVQKATNTLTSCGNTATLTKVDAASPIDTGFQTRTHTTKISFTPTDATYACGGYQENSNNQAVFAVTCKRKEGYVKAFDYTFVSYYDATAGACTALQIEAVQNPNVADPPTVDHKLELGVTFKAYTNSDIANVPWPNGPQSVDGAHGGVIGEVKTAAIPLGTNIYFEICLISRSTPASPSYSQFFEDGVGFIGISVTKCTAKNDATAGTPGIGPDTPVTFIDKGCGLGVNPAEFISNIAGVNNGRGFMYVKDTTDGTKDWLRPPNCFRSPPTEAVSMERADGDADAVTVYECKIEYTHSSDTTESFGDKTQDRQGYPTCARKKREANHMGAGYPTKVSMAVRVALPGFNKTHVESCPETIMLVSVSTILSMLLFVAILVAGVMIYSLQTLNVADNDSCASSVIEIINKGY